MSKIKWITIGRDRGCPGDFVMVNPGRREKCTEGKCLNTSSDEDYEEPLKHGSWHFFDGFGLREKLDYKSFKRMTGLTIKPGEIIKARMIKSVKKRKKYRQNS